MTCADPFGRFEPITCCPDDIADHDTLFRVWLDYAKERAADPICIYPQNNAEKIHCLDQAQFGFGDLLELTLFAPIAVAPFILYGIVSWATGIWLRK